MASDVETIRAGAHPNLRALVMSPKQATMGHLGHASLAGSGSAGSVRCESVRKCQEKHPRQ